MAENLGLPEGFVLDELIDEGLPEGFILDRPITKTKPKTFWGALGAEITPQMRQQAPIPSAIAQTAQDIFATPAAFINQLLLNYPRYALEKKGIEYPEAGETLGGKIGYYGGGITGAAVSPFLRAIGTLTGAGKVIAPTTRLAGRIGRGALGGAITGGVYGQPMEQRPVSTGIGAILGGLFGVVAGKVRTPKQLLTKEDKFLLQKSDDIYNVTQKAKGSIQQEYAVFRDTTKDTPVDLENINTSIRKLYGKTAKDVKEILPEEFTKEIKLIADEAIDSNLDIVYKVKDTISKHIKPATWRKFKIGEQLTPDQEKLISSYFDFDKLIDNSLEKGGLLEEKQMLDYLNQKATDLYGITGQVKKMVVDVLGKPQKTTTIRSIFLGQGDAGKKALFQQLSEFEPEILDITKGLEKYRNTQNIKRILIRTGIILGGGTLAGTGGKIGWEILKKE